MEVTVAARPGIRLALALAVPAALLPLAAFAQSTDDKISQAASAAQTAGIGADTVWTIVAACFVLFMQAGFAMLEVGFSRMKNVGTVVAKVIVNLSISSIVYWMVGFAVAFGTASGWIGQVLGHSGFFPTFHPGTTLPG